MWYNGKYRYTVYLKYSETGMYYACCGDRFAKFVYTKHRKIFAEGDERASFGGAAGTDESARDYAREQNIPITEYFPDYARYG